MEETLDHNDEIVPFSAFSMGGEGTGFPRVARDDADVGFGQSETAISETATSGMLMTGGGGVVNAIRRRGRGRGRGDGEAPPLVGRDSQFIWNPDIIQDLGGVVTEAERERERQRENSRHVRACRLTASARRRDGLMVRFLTDLDSSVEAVRALRDMDAGNDDVVPMVQDLGTDAPMATQQDSQVDAMNAWKPEAFSHPMIITSF